MLQENGTITQQQHEKLIEALNVDEEKLRIPANDIVTTEKDIEVGTEEEINVSSKDDAFAFELGERLMLGLALHDEDRNLLGDGTQLRRARLDLGGKLFYDWSYELAAEFGDGDVEIRMRISLITAGPHKPAGRSI